MLTFLILLPVRQRGNSSHFIWKQQHLITHRAAAHPPQQQTHTHGGVQSIDQYLSLAINVAGSECEARVGGAAAFLAASVRPASVHSTLSIPCQLVALRHILPNTQETGTHPPPPSAAHLPMQSHQEMAATTIPCTLPPPLLPDKSLLGLSIIMTTE